MRCNDLLAFGIVVVCWGALAGGAKADLIGTVDYRDTFTVGANGRGDGHYSAAESGTPYDIEYTRSGLTTAHWTPMSAQGFSFNSSLTALKTYGYVTTGNSGAAAGVAQTGGGENGIAYGLRNDFVTQTDYACRDAGYFDIWSGDASGLNTLYVMFRKGNDSIGVGYVNANGTWSETMLGVVSGIGSTDTTWHNAGVHFNKSDNTLGIYVDEALKVTVDMANIAGGAYKDYSTSHTGWGAQNGGDTLFVTWVDNFAVGSAVPEPASIVLTLAGLVGVMVQAWRKRKCVPS